MTPLFTISPDVRLLYPEIKIAYSVIKGVTVKTEHPELLKLSNKIITSVREKLVGKSVTELPRIKAFRAIYKRFGFDPTSKRPSAEALLRRVIDPKKTLYRLNTVVDTYNLLSIDFQLPMAAYNFDRLSLPIELRLAKDGDLYKGIGEESFISLTSPSEIVYADQCQILCRGFNYRDADETKVTLETRNIIVFVDGCSEVSVDELQQAIYSVSEQIISLNGGTISVLTVV